MTKEAKIFVTEKELSVIVKSLRALECVINDIPNVEWGISISCGEGLLCSQLHKKCLSILKMFNGEVKK